LRSPASRSRPLADNFFDCACTTRRRSSRAVACVRFGYALRQEQALDLLDNVGCLEMTNTAPACPAPSRPQAARRGSSAPTITPAVAAKPCRSPPVDLMTSTPRPTCETSAALPHWSAVRGLSFRLCVLPSATKRARLGPLSFSPARSACSQCLPRQKSIRALRPSTSAGCSDVHALGGAENAVRVLDTIASTPVEAASTWARDRSGASAGRMSKFVARGGGREGTDSRN
jgi:hypothetical protein